MAKAVSLDDQIKCIRFELALMRHTYYHFVARGTVTKRAATQRLTAMEAALATLQSLKEG